MAVYRIFPEKDTFISSQKPDSNAGLDEIIEIGNYTHFGVTEVSRGRVQFSDTDLDFVKSIADLSSITSSFKMYLASAESVPTEYTLEMYPLSHSWINGTGKFDDSTNPKDGITWNTTGSNEWYLISGGLETHGMRSTHDTSINITSGVLSHMNREIPNNGFVIKLEDSLENNNDLDFKLNYFSIDTNTIYPPHLEVGWNDVTRVTGSREEITTTNLLFNINNKGEYTNEGKQKFNITVRPKYPPRTFGTQSIYLNNYLLPEESYWGLKDYDNGMMVVDFSNNTRISANEEGSFFTMYMNGLQPERYYKLVVKTEIDGSTLVLDDEIIFKIIENV